jgi:hypothetical protein
LLAKTTFFNQHTRCCVKKQEFFEIFFIFVR